MKQTVSTLCKSARTFEASEGQEKDYERLFIQVGVRKNFCWTMLSTTYRKTMRNP